MAESAQNAAPTTHEIRLASPADAEQMAILGAQVFAATYGHSVAAEDLQEYLDQNYSANAVLEDIKDANKSIFVASDQHGKIVGYMYMTRGTSETCIAGVTNKIEMERLYVLPSVHWMGIGRLLAQDGEAFARKQGATHIWLGVWEHNERAYRVYERWGYLPVGEHMFSIGTAAQRDIIMLKKLDGIA